MEMGARNSLRAQKRLKTVHRCGPRLRHGLLAQTASPTPDVSFILECSEKLVPGRVGVMVKGQKSGEAGIPGSGKMLRHCFWTRSFS